LTSLSVYLEWQALGYFLLHLVNLFVASGAAKAFVWGACSLLAGVISAFFIIILIPRILEDYVKIYNWYVNSDFFILYEEKVDVRLVFKLIALPFALVFSLIVLILNLMVRIAYQLASKLNLLRCVNCHSIIDWNEGTVHCHICGEKVRGTMVKSCPGCNFKPNAIRCPFCGYIVFVGLIGQHPSGRAGRAQNNDAAAEEAKRT